MGGLILSVTFQTLLLSGLLLALEEISLKKAKGQKLTIHIIKLDRSFLWFKQVSTYNE